MEVGEVDDVCTSGTVFVEGVCVCVCVCMAACCPLEVGEAVVAVVVLLSAGAPSAWLIKKLIHSSARLSP